MRTVNYGVVKVSRNLDRANENAGFKMTALEYEFRYNIAATLYFLIFLFHSQLSLTLSIAPIDRRIVIKKPADPTSAMPTHDGTVLPLTKVTFNQ